MRVIIIVENQCYPFKMIYIETVATDQPEELVSMLLDRIGYNNIYSFDKHGGRTNDKTNSFYNAHFKDKLD